MFHPVELSVVPQPILRRASLIQPLMSALRDMENERPYLIIDAGQHTLVAQHETMTPIFSFFREPVKLRYLNQ